MNKIIALGLITVFLLFIYGCAQEVTPPAEKPEAKETAVAQTSDAIEQADKTLQDLEDKETDAELDNIGNLLNQI